MMTPCLEKAVGMGCSPIASGLVEGDAWIHLKAYWEGPAAGVWPSTVLAEEKRTVTRTAYSGREWLNSFHGQKLATCEKELMCGRAQTLPSKAPRMGRQASATRSPRQGKHTRTCGGLP